MGNAASTTTGRPTIVLVVESWPDDGHEAWVRRLVTQLKPELFDTSIEKIHSGRNNASFKVGDKYIVSRSRYPKHRAWAYHDKAALACLAPTIRLQKYDHATKQSLEITEMANGGELMAISAYVSVDNAVVPDNAMLAKCGRLLARLHKMDTSWHASFVNATVAKNAQIPNKSKEELMDVFDPPEGFLPCAMQKFVSKALSEKLVEKIGCDKNFIANEVQRILDHPILPSTGPLACSNTVSAHGDFHGANIVIHDGMPLAVDFELCFVGPAGYDVACFYEFCIRRLAPKHDHASTTVFAKAYLDEMNDEATPIDDFIFDILAWNYFLTIRGCILVQLLDAQGISTELIKRSNRLLQRDHLEAYCKTILTARENPAMRKNIVASGKIAPSSSLV